MSIFLTTSSIFAENKNPKVVVIGAGLAGLTTAYRLQKDGIDVELYEARNRVGGRVFTININGNIAELGAQNISDGGEAFNVRRLIDEFGLEVTRTQVELQDFYFDKKELISIRKLLNDKQFNPQTLKNRLNELMLKSDNMKDILDGIIERNDPLYQVLAVRLAAYEGAPIEQLSPLYIETLYHLLMGGICSVHQNYVTLASIKGGNALLPEKMAEALGSRVHLNMPLTRLSKKADDTFELIFGDGQRIIPDKVVLAIPCSVYEKIIFEDNVMDGNRLQAIKSVQYGTNAKLLVPCSQLPTKGKGFINDQVTSFCDVTRSLLTVYYTGESSLFSDETIFHAYTQIRPMMEMGLEDICPSFTTPVYAEDRAFASYDAPVGYSWPNDPYARGSYSYIFAGQESLLTAMSEEKGETFKALFAPIENRLYFAGEHTSVLMEVPGTMEAACESGERISRSILNSISTHSNQQTKEMDGLALKEVY